MPQPAYTFVWLFMCQSTRSPNTLSPGVSSGGWFISISKTRNANAVAQRVNIPQTVRASLPYDISNRRSSRVLICRSAPPHPRRCFPPQALQSASGKHKISLSPERAYCLFRMERLEEALDVARSSGGTVEGSKRVNALRQLEAQVQRYRVWPSRS